ncbi:MAG: hypothetical protein E6I29_11180 [Chloroflexi bacterium]|nr:MAG: hypothetical protein E6I29_11180 [Chloroflexota bacterium]
MGVVLALALLCLLALGLWWTWRRPFVGLGLLVAGFAFHSFLLMVLLRLGTPAVLVRAFQGWKEILIAALTVIVLMRIWRELRTGRSGLLLFTDWIAIGLAVITIVYFLLPESILHSGTNFAQRLVGFRVIALIPLIYFLARRLEPAGDADLQTVLWLAMGAGAIVSLFGVFELFFVPTRTWIDWGVNQYTQILGFKYNGPGGMPPNFFVTLPDGTLLRRVVSTYISPLGVAYTGLLLFPLGVVLIDRQRARSSAKWLAIAALTLVLIGVMFAVTRLALFALVGEAGLMWLLLRRGWIAALVPGDLRQRQLRAGALRLSDRRPQVRPAASLRSRDRGLDRSLRPAGGDWGKRGARDVRRPGHHRRPAVCRLLPARALERVARLSGGAEGFAGRGAAADRPCGRPRAAPGHGDQRRLG